MCKPKDFLLAVMAGAMISIGGVVNLSVSNTIIGAFLFSIGLFFVVVCGFNLFTGKVGYLIGNDFKYLIFLGVVWLGNIVGAFAVGTLIRLTRKAADTAFMEKAINLCTVKNNDTPLSIFVLSVFCGFLMFLAVDNYKKIQDSMGKNFAVIICVAVFIIAGFEHCVANMFYYSVAGMWSVHSLIYVIIMSLGNGVGSWILPLVYKFTSK